MIIIDFNWNVGISRPPLIISSRNNAHSVSATPLNIVNTKSPTVWNICGYIIEILIIIKFVIIILKYLCILIVLMVWWFAERSVLQLLFIYLLHYTVQPKMEIIFMMAIISPCSSSSISVGSGCFWKAFNKSISQTVKKWKWSRCKWVNWYWLGLACVHPTKT